LHGWAFGNRDGSIHILKDGTLDQVFESLEKLLNLDHCLCDQAIFGDGSRTFELEAMFTCEPIRPRSTGFGDAFAYKRIDSLRTLGLAKKGNARVEPLGSELKSVIYYAGN
jgi:hypothetical protein